MERQRLFILLGFVFLLIALVTIPFGEAFTAEKPQFGGVLKISRSAGVRGVGFPLTTKIGESYVSWPCVETLLKLDKQGQPVPHLVESWEVDNTGKKMTLHLKKGVKFHDGTDFNAEAVKYFIDVIEPAAGKNNIKRYIDSSEILDEHTVRINLPKWDNMLVIRMAIHAKIISPKSFKTHGKKWCQQHPVGTGPFKFVKWDKDVMIKLERFDGYWGGKPYLDGIEFHIIVDPMTQMTAFLAGEHHIMADVNPKDAKNLKAKGKFKVTHVPGQYHSIHGDGGNPDSIWANVKVRQAMAHAINTPAIAEAVGHGYWSVAPRGQLAQPRGWNDNPQVKGYAYDPAKAKRLLAEAGYPNGFKTTILCLNKPQHIVDSVTAIQGQLRKVGIDAHLDLMDRGRDFKVTIGGGWKDGLHHVAMTWRHEIDLMESIYRPGSIFTKSIARPKEYAGILGKALQETDFKKMKKLVFAMQKLDVDKYAMNNWLYLVNYIAVKSPKVHGDKFFEECNINWDPGKAWLSK
ncbi:MAG: ABC transporter substrate-binding protein [Deltaproteobacteria bacterium]|nr:ABC transporter substrate-binding protein [Deltaproteobacteria bacterium]